MSNKREQTFDMLLHADKGEHKKFVSDRIEEGSNAMNVQENDDMAEIICMDKKYSKHYDEKLFFRIIRRLPRKIATQCMKVYYIMKHPQIRSNEKWLCILGLGYVVFPFDCIPDPIIVFGFFDDIAVITYILKKLLHWSKDEWVVQQVEDFFCRGRVHINPCI